MPKPPPLLPGSRVLVVAPGSAPRDAARLEKGLAALTARGFEVETLRSDFAPHGFLAGPDAVRIDEFNRALAHPTATAIFCVRGGYGALRLLPYLDYDAARRHPKLLVGYSDITALHLALWEKARLPGLSGPMVAVEWDAMDTLSEDLFWHLARGGTGPVVGPGGEALEGVRDGDAEGVLLGGNLSLVARLIGTPYLPDLTGAILFLEEVGEEPYRVDGLLAHLKLAGILDSLGGLVLGGFTESEPSPDRPFLPLDTIVNDYTRDLNLPVARGLVYGHFPVKNTLPVGVRARLQVRGETASLDILENVVDG